LRQADNQQPELKGTLDEPMKQAMKDAGIDAKDVFSRSRVRKVVRARAFYRYLAKERCGASGAQLMKQLRLISGTISHFVAQGREIHREQY